MKRDAQGIPKAGPPDREAVLARLGGNAGLAAEVAAILLEDCLGWLTRLAGALEQGDARTLQFTAHLLRDSVSALGPCAAYHAAGELEALARAGNLAGAAGACATLEAAVRGLEPFLAALARAPEPTRRDSTGGPAGAGGDVVRVLIAEDDRVTRRMLEVILGEWGLETVSVTDGVAAWEVLQTEGGAKA